MKYLLICKFIPMWKFVVLKNFVTICNFSSEHAAVSAYTFYQCTISIIVICVNKREASMQGRGLLFWCIYLIIQPKKYTTITNHATIIADASGHKTTPWLRCQELNLHVHNSLELYIEVNDVCALLLLPELLIAYLSSRSRIAWLKQFLCNL